MDLKHVEELAKDKELVHGAIACYFMDYNVDAFEHEDGTKYYKDLTDTEKINLIGSAYYYWLKTDIDTSLGIICDCVMSNQKAVLDNKLSNKHFFDKLALML
jgi:hypothetical protein